MDNLGRGASGAGVAGGGCGVGVGIFTGGGSSVAAAGATGLGGSGGEAFFKGRGIFFDSVLGASVAGALAGAEVGVATPAKAG